MSIEKRQPFIHKTADVQTRKIGMESAVDQIIQDLQRALVLDAVAWCFPMAYRGVPSRRYGGKFYPGTFLAVQAAYPGTAQ